MPKFSKALEASFAREEAGEELPKEFHALIELIAAAVARRIQTPEEYLTKEEAAQLLKVSPVALKRMTQKREITCYQKGRLIRYAAHDLIEWMASGKKAGAKP